MKRNILRFFVCVIVLWTYRVRLNGTHRIPPMGRPLFTGRQPTGLKVRLLNMKPLSAEAVNDSAIFLTGTKNPDTDEYQLLQVFIVDRTDNSF